MIELLYKAGGLIAAIYAIYKAWQKVVKPSLEVVWEKLYWDWTKGACIRFGCLNLLDFLGEIDGSYKYHRTHYNEPNYPYPPDDPRAKYAWIEEAQKWVPKDRLKIEMMFIQAGKTRLTLPEFQETHFWDHVDYEWVPKSMLPH